MSLILDNKLFNMLVEFFWVSLSGAQQVQCMQLTMSAASRLC